MTIQLAKASGVAVITTASSHNFASMKSQLGADYVFDYKSASVVDDIVGAVEQLKTDGHDFVGVYDALSLAPSFQAIGQVFEKLGASKLCSTHKLVSVLPPSDDAGLPSDIKVQSVFAAVLDQDALDASWTNFVAEGLEKGVLRPLPPASVVGKGLESVQKGLDENRKGVSFSKVVVEL